MGMTSFFIGSWRWWLEMMVGKLLEIVVVGDSGWKIAEVGGDWRRWSEMVAADNSSRKWAFK
jgi:hypothetical protein